MNFKKYDEILDTLKYDTLFFMIYYSLKCNDDFKTLKENETTRLVCFIHSAYLQDETHLDLFHICDKAIENKEKILNHQFTKWDLLEACC